MAEKRYVVTGHCALVTQHSALGAVKAMLLRGNLIGPGMTDAERDHNLTGNLIAEVPGDEAVGVDAAGQPVAGAERVVGDGEPGGPVDYTPGPTPAPEGDDDRRRAAAKAKLPADGTAPHPNAGKDVWVEYAVVKGMDRVEAEKAEKSDLTAALKS